MGALLVCWVLLPVVLGILSLGCGLLVEKASGTRLTGALVIPVGFAALIAVAGLPILVSSLAKFATPLVVVVAAIGFIVSWPFDYRRLGAPLAVAGIVFLAYGAPVLLTGKATFVGFNKLDDTSTWLGITDWVMAHGRNLSGLKPSTYEYVLHNYVGGGYPVGGFLPFGIGHRLLGQDNAWLFAPTISFMAAMLGMSLYALGEPLVAGPVRRGAVAAFASLPALLIGYAWWGSIKEVIAAALIAMAAALAAPAMRSWPGLRALLPLAVVLAAVVGVLSVGGLAWVLPVLVPPVVASVYRARHTLLRALRRSPVRVGAALVVLAALSLPALATLGRFERAARIQFSTSKDLGVLHGPLSAFQGLGIWPSGDFRLDPVNEPLTYLLIGVVMLASVAGGVWAWKRRSWGLLLYAFGSLVGAGVIFLTAGPWVGAKALAIASPAAPFVALALSALIYEHGRRLEAAVLTALVVGGVIWSFTLQYHGAFVAPRSQLRELQHIGGLLDGKGPTLLTEFEPYAARHFLRNAEPESISDLRRRLVFLRKGGIALQGEHADLDAIKLPDVMVYRSLVVRRTPVASRPPAPYRLIWKGRFYEVWQRAPAQSPIVAHLPLGNADDPTGVANCAALLALARAPGVARVAFVPRDKPVRIGLGRLALPRRWDPSAVDADVVYPRSAGTLRAQVKIDHPATYRAWVGSSFRARVEVEVDGRSAGAARNQLNYAGGYTPLGSVRLAPGSHTVTLRYSGPDWRPGSGGPAVPLGPLFLADQTADRRVLAVPPSAARTLCGKQLDWIETLSQ